MLNYAFLETTFNQSYKMEWYIAEGAVFDVQPIIKKKNNKIAVLHFFLPNLHQPLTFIRKLLAHGGQATRCYSRVRQRFFIISFQQPAGKVSVFTQTHWYVVAETGRGPGVENTLCVEDGQNCIVWGHTDTDQKIQGNRPWDWGGEAAEGDAARYHLAAQWCKTKPLANSRLLEYTY